MGRLFIIIIIIIIEVYISRGLKDRSTLMCVSFLQNLKYIYKIFPVGQRKINENRIAFLWCYSL